LIIGFRTVKTKRGDTMAILTLDDRSARIEATVFADLYHECRDKLVKDAIVVIEGEVKNDDYSGGLRIGATTVTSLNEARAKYAKELVVHIGHHDFVSQFAQQFRDSLKPLAKESVEVGE
jgi:DNA polymerase-3 subunit alpha